MTPPLPILRVLGVPALHGPDGEPISFRTRKHFALLIYLALEPQSHRREKLAALLWPRATTSEARHSLSTGLSVLRARLGGEKIETSRDTARLVPGAVELDLERLARGEIHATETMAALDIAPLIHDFPVADALPWEQWRDGLAAKWQPAIRDALLARIERVRRQGNTRTMEVLADTLLILDDLSEDGVRAKMESRAFAGDRLTALQIYEDWRVRLADELGAQPSDLVAGMALRLRRRGWERTSGEHIPSVRTDQWKNRPFVGRAKEYEVLYEGWEGCGRGTAQHVLITGESGVGKSTLMERLTTAAGLQGAIAARVQCHAVEREIPYGAIGSLIGMLLDRPGATAVAPEWLSELSRMVSAVRRRFPNVAPPPEATGEMVRIRLADAFHELVRAIAEEQPLILVMDDIHLGDDASVAVMHLLLRRLTDERVLVLCTLRQGDGPVGPSARGMFDRAELARMTVLPLPPLSETESIELMGQLIPDDIAPPPGTVRRALLRAGGGLPMLLELLVRDWMSHGDRCVALAVGAMTEEPGTAGGAGETYRRLLERLTLGLDPNTRSVLNLAAILGSQLNEFELYSLVDLTLAQAMTGLSQLASDRIMRDSGHGLEFVNEVMRGEVYLAVPSSVRKVLHSKVADRLIQRSQAGEEMLGLATAWHCVRSGRIEEAGEWLLVGGDEAITRSALADAEAALESGYANLPSPYRERIGTTLSEVLFDQSRYEEAHMLAASLPDSDTGDWGRRTIRTKQLLALGQRLYAKAHHEALLPALLDIIASEEPAGYRMRAANLSTSLVSLSQDRRHLEEVMSSLDHLRDGSLTPLLAARRELLRAQILYWQRRVPEAEEVLNSLRATQPHDGPALHAFSLHIGLGACHASRGDYTTSIALAAQAGTIAGRAGSPVKEAQAHGNRSIGLYRLGRHTEALAAAALSRRLAGEEDSTMTPAIAYGIELCCLAEDDPNGHFYPLLERARKFARRDLATAVGAIHRLWVADALWLKAEGATALALAQEAVDSLEVSNWPWMGAVCRWASKLAGVNGEPRYLTFVRHGVESMPLLDLLDQFEVAIAAQDCLMISQDETKRLQSIAEAASLGLPEPAIRNARRLQKVRIEHFPLAQHPHPSA